MRIFMCLEYRFWKSVNGNSLEIGVLIIGQLMIYP